MERVVRTMDAGIASTVATVLTCIFCLLLCAPAFSLDRDRSINQFYYTFWNEKEGAPSQITALAQTEDGYLWIGSGRGLFRFDGVRFEEYKPQPGVKLPSYSIFALMPTPDGGLWIAFSPNGLAFLKNGSLTVFTRKNELPDSPIHCFARDQEGRIWAGTEAGLVLRQGTRWIDIGRRWNLPREMIRYLLVDREGTLWVATIKRIAFLSQGSRRFKLGGAVGTGVTTLAQAKDGRVWFADDGSGEVRPVPLDGHSSDTELPAVVGNGLRELLFDRDGALWITDTDSGIIRIRYPEKLKDRNYGLHDPELESISKKSGFSGDLADQLLEDHEGNIWVGCSKGLIQFRHSDVVPVALPDGYQKVTLLAGKHGGLWVGTIDERPLLHIRGENAFREGAGEEVASVLRGPNGDIWWGSRTGIWRQRGTEFRYFLLPKQAVPDWMWDIIPDRADGGLWIKLGDVGFVHFKKGVWNLHAWPKGVPTVGGTFRYGPSASYDDRSGRIWLGYTSGQIVVLDGAKVTVYSEKQGLDVGRIKVIRGLSRQIWVGGDLGLMFFSKGHFSRVMVAGDEQLGAVSGIIETPAGGLWLNEMRGIVHIPPEEIRQFIADPNYRVRYRRFDYLDGSPGAPQMEFTVSTAIETSDGRLWFATDNGLAMIDPDDLVKNRIPPPVSIVSIADRKGLRPISSAVKFAAGTHTVEIDYTALSLSAPERVKFRYRLDGVDADWQDVGTRREAYYSNLGPGSYRFRVIACNNDGVWNNVGASLDFSIAPEFYETLWFRLACLVIFALLLWALYQFRLLSIKQRYLERSHFEEALRRAQADLAHINRVSTLGELTASLAHDIKQPIGAAVTNAEACLRFLDRGQPDIAEAREAALEMARDGRRAADIIDRVRSLYRKGSTQQEIVDVNEIIREMAAMLHNEANRHSVTIRTELAENLPPVMADRVQLQQVLMNLMLNGIEAMRETAGELTLKSQLSEDGQLLISVTDTGVGLPTEEADQIFNAFFTTKSQGTGMGLPITRSIVESHGGRVWATANSGPGMTFQFTLPGRVGQSA
jgi:signal transduction histidine kinase/ligand-binding sensor domain-containing protein